MTTMNDSPSILILRSTCGGADGATEDDLHSLPLWCDLTVMPEMDDSKHVSVHVQEQGLNPCGVDNVLLLQDLSPGQGYLMSLVNCYTIVAGDDDDVHREIHLSTNPSTFFFDVPVSPSAKDNGVMINTKKSSTELHVVFDMIAAVQDLHLVSEHEKQHTECSPPVFEAPSSNTTYQHSSYNQDELLRVLETLASREVQDVDFLLVSLGAVFVLLVVVYAWVVVSMIKKEKVSSRKNGSKKSARSLLLPPCRSPTRTYPRTASSLTVEDPDDCRTKADVPPVVDVIIDRKRVVDSPRFVDDHPRKSSFMSSTTFNDRRSKADVPSVVDVILDHNNQDNETPQFAGENDSDLVKSIRASPVFTSFSRGNQQTVATVAKLSFMPVRNQNTKPTPPPPRFLVPPSPINNTQQETARDLSPCSKLARDWEQKKAVRRNKRRSRGTTQPHLVPVAAVPEDGCVVVAEHVAPNNMVPTISRKRIVPVFGDENNAPPEDLPDSAGVPTSVSDGSFLNDYW
jgi:hypothetical protein